ncbi:MAG: prolyl aminopeptidase, partial [Actinomycetota bacterium]
FLPEGRLLTGARDGGLDGIPTFLAHGRLDVSAPVDVPHTLAGLIDGAELFIAEVDGHGGQAISAWTVSVTDRLAAEGTGAG